jgi:hypothetical protein
MFHQQLVFPYRMVKETNAAPDDFCLQTVLSILRLQCDDNKGGGRCSQSGGS